MKPLPLSIPKVNAWFKLLWMQLVLEEPPSSLLTVFRLFNALIQSPSLMMAKVCHSILSLTFLKDYLTLTTLCFSVVELGNHNELIEKGGLYAKLVKQQQMH